MQELPQNTNSSNTSVINEANLKDLILGYIVYWKWFLVSVLISIFLAFFYLRYTTTQYGVDASIIIKDDKKGGNSELSAFSDLNIFSGKSNVENEMAILKSRTLSLNVVNELNLDVSYYVDGRVKKTEVYDDSPIEIKFLSKSKKYIEKDTTFNIAQNSKSTVIISDFNKQNGRQYKIGQIIAADFGEFIVNVKNLSSIDNKVLVSKRNSYNVANSYAKRLNVNNQGKNNIINLNIVDPIKKRGEDYLNSIIEQYNYDAIKDRNIIADSTSSFIKRRLGIIAKELSDVEDEVESFKKSKRITDVESDAQISLSSVTDYERELLDIATQVKVINFMLNVVDNLKEDEIIPSNLLSNADVSTSFIDKYNTAVLTKKRLLSSPEGQYFNPAIQKYDLQIEGYKASVRESLMNKLASLNISKNDISRLENRYDNKVYEVPTNEKNFRKIDRQQQIKQSLYLYLLQKREETEISLAITSPKAKIVDAAFVSGPVSPNRNAIYLIAFLIGMIIPAGIVFLIKMLDTKVKSRHDIEGKVTIPFLGDLPKSESNEQIIQSNSRSSSAEAIRMIRTNLEFMLSHVPENQCKTIFVTSSIPKEGKTFCAINLATTIALSGKKVLIVGLDIRNPKLDNYIDLPTKGLTNFLSKNNEDINDYIVNVKGFENFYALPSGAIPPNPVELLLNDRISVMFDELKKKFDYIIVDTAPVTVVTDTLLIAKNADSFIYVVRAN